MTFEKEQKIIIISNRKVEKGEEVKFSLFLRNEYYGGKDEKPITGISSKVASHLRTALNSWFVSVYWSSFLSLYERFLQSGIPVFTLFKNQHLTTHFGGSKCCKLLLVRYCNLVCVLCGVFFVFWIKYIYIYVVFITCPMEPFTTPTNYKFSNSNSIWTFKRLLKAFLGTAVLGRSINKLYLINLLGIDPVKIDYSLLIRFTTSAMFQPVPYNMKPKLTDLHFLTAHLWLQVRLWGWRK